MATVLPEADSQTSDKANVVHHHEPASLLCRSDLAAVFVVNNCAPVFLPLEPAHLWYSGTLVETTATPMPATILPAMTMA